MPHAASPMPAGTTDCAFHRRSRSPAEFDVRELRVRSSACETSPAARWASIRAIDHKHPVVHHRWTCGLVTINSSSIKAQPNESLSRIRRRRASVMVSSAWPIGWGNADRAGAGLQMIRRRRSLALCLHLKPLPCRPDRCPLIESARIALTVKKCISPIELLMGRAEVPGNDRFPCSDLKCAKLQGGVRHGTGGIGLVQHCHRCI